MPLDWQSGALASGLHCYRRAQFFLAHEHWESVWLTLADPEKSFLQSLIQSAVAFHHYQTGNTIGAASLLRRALHRMQLCPDSVACIDTERFRAEASAWLAALDSGTLPTPATFPQIHPIS
jgi:predicted metal-dependent hydrolase